MTLDEVEVDELLLTQGQQAAKSNRPSSATEPEAEVASLPFVVQSTTATIGT